MAERGGKNIALCGRGAHLCKAVNVHGVEGGDVGVCRLVLARQRLGSHAACDGTGLILELLLAIRPCRMLGLPFRAYIPCRAERRRWLVWED